MEKLTYNWGGQMVLVAVITLAFCALAVRLRRQRMPFGLASAPTVLAVGSALAIAAVTLTPQAQTAVPGEIDLRPFHSLREYHWTGMHDLVIYAGGNVALFVPLGFFLFLALRPVVGATTVLAASALASGASLAVEILQIPIWSRSTDVDDWITNTIGGRRRALLALVLYGLYTLVRPTRPTTPPAEPRLQGVGSAAS